MDIRRNALSSLNGNIDGEKAIDISKQLQAANRKWCHMLAV
jgi:hypothetical protein